MTIGECPKPYGGSLATSDGGENIWEYEVEWSKRPYFNGGNGGQKLVDELVCIIENLTVDQNYYFRVLARNNIGSSKWSEVVEADP